MPFNNSYYGNGANQSFLSHLREFIGQTVTVFTTSGGASGCGFTGIVLMVGNDFIRLTAQQSTPPVNPLSATVCPQFNFGGVDTTNATVTSTETANATYNSYRPVYTVGSICDIPIDKIAAFCHNAV